MYNRCEILLPLELLFTNGTRTTGKQQHDASGSAIPTYPSRCMSVCVYAHTSYQHKTTRPA